MALLRKNRREQRDSNFQEMDLDSGYFRKLFSHIRRVNGSVDEPTTILNVGALMGRRLWKPGPIIFETSHPSVTMTLMTTLLQELRSSIGAFATSLWMTLMLS